MKKDEESTSDSVGPNTPLFCILCYLLVLNHLLLRRTSIVRFSWI